MTRFSTIAIAALVGVALPVAVSAAPKPAGPDVSTSEQQSGAAKPQRYCVVQNITGSLLAKRDCRTLDAWLATGFDPRAKK